MTTALEVINRAARVLHDESFARWTKAELLDWVSEAQVVVAKNPGLYNRSVAHTLSSGARQHLPNDAWALITVRYNLDGTLPVSSIKLTSREILDAFVPMWNRRPQQKLVENYMYDERTPKDFFVYPPNDGTGKVDLTYMAIPAALTSENDVLVLDDMCVPALTNYVVYRAYCKESDYSSGITNAQGYLAAYQAELNSVLASRGLATPNAALMPNTIVNTTGGTE